MADIPEDNKVLSVDPIADEAKQRDIAIEQAKVSLESAKLDLKKKQFDTYLAIVRDVVLIIAILGSAAFNFLNGNEQKAQLSAPTPAGELGLSGAGMGGGGGTVGAEVVHRIHAYHVVHSAQPNIFTLHNFLWAVVLFAVIFLIIPRLKKWTKRQ